MEKPTIAIGDVHGQDLWRDVVEAHPECRIVFLGDYLDPFFYMPKERLLGNLREIIDFKRSRPEDTVLLLGNHDLHYFCEEASPASRFDAGIVGEASSLFLDNLDLFQYAFQDGEYLFTHAGVSQLWFDYDFCGDASRSVAEQLNNPAADQVAALHRVGYARGGRTCDTGGIFWADKSELEEPLRCFTQIVGHNRVAEVTGHTGPGGGKIVFCDCLRNGLYLYI
jgi:hypothetical protein